jgi:hypothetical protein
VVNTDYLLAAQEVNLFLKGPQNFKDVAKRYEFEVYRAILQNYTTSFNIIALEEPESSILKKLSEYENRIKIAFNLLKTIDRCIHSTGNSLKSFKVDLYKLFILHQQFEGILFTHYEVPSRNVINFDIISPASIEVDPYQIFKNWVETERYEFLAILEAAQSRARLAHVRRNLDLKLADYYEIRGSKFRAFIHKLKYSSNEAQVYNTEESLKSAIDDIKQLEAIVMARQLTYEYPKFIEDREYNFRDMMNRLGNVTGLESFKVRYTQLLQIMKNLEAQVS